MALITPESGNPSRELTPQDYKANGQLASKSAELALVLGSAKSAEQFITNKQYGLLWRDADLKYGVTL